MGNGGTPPEIQTWVLLDGTIHGLQIQTAVCRTTGAVFMYSIVRSLHSGLYYTTSRWNSTGLHCAARRLITSWYRNRRCSHSVTLLMCPASTKCERAESYAAVDNNITGISSDKIYTTGWWVKSVNGKSKTSNVIIVRLGNSKSSDNAGTAQSCKEPEPGVC